LIAVLDTSALIRFYIPDGPMPDGMEAFMADLDRGVATALVPGLIWVEAASVLLKKINRGEIKDSEAIELLRLWRTLPFKEIETSASILEILKLARNESLSSYDATYLYLAIQHHAVLFTADDLLTKAAQRYRT
jgi:predicted nucleic acid-binding protein